MSATRWVSYRWPTCLRSDVAYRRARLRLLTDRTRFVEAVLAERRAIGELSGNDPVLRSTANPAASDNAQGKVHS
jgi:hypothetical protein